MDIGEKIKRMRIYFPHVKLIVIDGDSYKDIKNNWIS